MHVDVLRKLIAACTPDEPLSPDEPRRFQFDELLLRGEPWCAHLASVIRCSPEPSAQLVTGFRGSGKTTELHQLREMLRQTNHHVVIADASEWLGDERPILPEDLSLALLLSLAPDGKLEHAKAWVREYGTKVQQFLNAEAKLDGDLHDAHLLLTTDRRVFGRVAKQLRERSGVRRQIHALLGDAAEASRAAGEKLVILLDGAERRALGQLHERERRTDFYNGWVDAFIRGDRDLKPPVHVVYTVPPFMVRFSAELEATFGSKLHFLPMVRVYDRGSKLEVAGVEAMTEALLMRIPKQHFADEVTPCWLAAQSGGFFRELLRFAIEMVYQARDAPRFTRAHAEAAVRHTRQIDFDALLREEKDLLARVHASKSLLEQEAAQHRVDTLLQSGKLFRYDDGEGWYDAVPSCWPRLGFADDLPSWEHLAALHG